MYRFLYADQIIGSIFVDLLRQNKTSISLRELFKTEKLLDTALRKKNKTATSMTISDVYHTVNKYPNIFILSDESITVRNLSDSTITYINDYLKAGIPDDINKTIELVLGGK